MQISLFLLLSFILLCTVNCYNAGLDCSGPHEYYACSRACDNVCSRLQFESQEKCRIVNIKCNDKCYCEKGYARNDKNICIPISECPPNCPFDNEKYVKDKPICPSDLCSSIVSKCAPKSSGCPGCVCDSGYFRKAKGEPCVPSCECPELKNSPECSNYNKK